MEYINVGLHINDEGISRQTNGDIYCTVKNWCEYMKRIEKTKDVPEFYNLMLDCIYDYWMKDND